MKAHRHRWTAGAAFVLWAATQGWAQRADTTGAAAGLPLDTQAVYYLQAWAPEHVHCADDTLPDATFRMYDPARRPLIDWGTLGNIGSSARPLWYQTAPQRGAHTGYRVFNLYYLHANDLPFFVGNRSITDLFVSQGRTQNDLMLRAKFSRTFAKGVNFSIFHQNLNHLGQYRYQAVKHMSLAVGIWYPVNRRFDSFVIVARNVSKQQENGGLANPETIGGGQFGGPITAEVRLPDQQALSRHARTAVSWINYWTPMGTPKQSGRSLRLSHRADWSIERFKFSDPGSRPGLPLGRDAAFFDTFLVDPRGVRHYAEWERIDNSLELSTFAQKAPTTPANVTAVSLQHSFLRWRQEPFADTAFQNLFLNGRLRWSVGRRLSIDLNGSIGLLSNLGEYHLDGRLSLELGRIGTLEAALLSQRYPPALLARRLGVSGRPFWHNELEKPVENMLSVKYLLPAAGFWISAQTHQVNQYIYYDQRSLPAQTALPLQVVQLSAGENLRWGRLRLDLCLAAQRFNRTDVVRLPEWFAKGALYHSGYLFGKRLLLDAGADFRLNAAFRPDAYQPLTAQFHLQDSLLAQTYPWIDVFLAFKVQSFRFFFRYENLITLWSTQRLFFQTAYYAQPFASVRLGIAWRFLDSLSTTPGTGPSPPEQ